MRVAKIVIMVAALSCGSAAAAENLIYYADDNDGRVYYYDSDTIRRSNSGRISVWVLQDGTNDRTVKWRTRRILWNIDCSEMSSGAAAFADYDANGSLMDSNTFNYPILSPNVPGSVGYSLVEAICAG